MPDTPRANLSVDGHRLWNSLMDMARIGPGVAGGNNRQALTDADGEARALFASWCKALGLTITTDRIGNMFARREGADAALDPVCLGSHLDTQPTGGKYDGVLGVLAALEAVRVLEDRNIATRRSILLVNWTNEEGTRFTPPIMGSSVFTGRYALEDVYESRDADGVRLGDEIERIGWRGEAEVGHQPMHCYLELHIEQGPLLEAAEKQIGVVTHGQGTRWIEGRIKGQDAHTGSTPMGMRRDAARGLGRLIDLAHDIAIAQAPNAVGTIAHIDVHPNSRNVIPGEIVFTADFRSHLPEVLASMQARFEAAAPQICAALGLGYDSRVTGAYEPPEFDARLVGAIRSAADRLGYGWSDLVSGAGHDASVMNAQVPSGMIMCPCVGGLSHNEAEEITPEWAEAGANVLLHAAIALAEEA